MKNIEDGRRLKWRRSNVALNYDEETTLIKSYIDYNKVGASEKQSLKKTKMKLDRQKKMW